MGHLRAGSGAAVAILLGQGLGGHALDGFPSGGVVFRDDGVFHNLRAQIAEILEADGLHVVLQRRIVVRLTADPAVIARRAMSREQAGGTRPQYAGRTLEEMEWRIRGSLERSEHVVAVMRSAGIPILEIDASEDAAAGVARAARLIIEAAASFFQPRCPDALA